MPVYAQKHRLPPCKLPASPKFMEPTSDAERQTCSWDQLICTQYSAGHNIPVENSTTAQENQNQENTNRSVANSITLFHRVASCLSLFGAPCIPLQLHDR